jgi:hypothetical protein
MPAIVAAASKLGMIVHLPESNHKDKTISKMAKIYKKHFGELFGTRKREQNTTNYQDLLVSQLPHS